MKRTLTLISLLLLLSIALEAQEVYDLRRCLEIGLEQNHAIRISSNSRQKSENNLTIGNAGYLPAVDLGGRYSGTVNDSKSRTAAGVVSESNGVHNETYTASADLSWNLFSGFSVHTTYKKLQELKQLGELDARLTIEDIISRIASQYYDLIQQNIRLRNFEYALSISKERVRIVQERYMLGSASKLELQQARVAYNTDSSSYIAQTETLYKTGIGLNELMAVEDVSLPPKIDSTEIQINKNLNFIELEAQMLDVNARLLAASRNYTISELNLKLVKSRTYPYLNTNAGYGYTRYKYGSGTTDYSQSLGFNYGITLGVNIFNGGNQRREVKNAKLDMMNKELEQAQLEQSLRAELSTIYNTYLNKLTLQKMEEENLKTAHESLNIAMERYKLGALSGIELREVQKDLLDAEERLLTVSFQAKLAEISLMQISGRILEYLN